MQCQQRINARSVVTSTRQQHAAGVVRARVSRGSRVMVEARSLAFVQRSVVSRALAAANRGSRSLRLVVSAVKDGAPLDRPLRVAVIGGGPSGACAAETLASGGVETYLLERKLDNCKVLDTATTRALNSPHDVPICIPKRSLCYQPAAGSGCQAAAGSFLWGGSMCGADTPIEQQTL